MTGFKSEAAALAHEQYMRSVYLDVLYELDKRDDPDHEFSGCYTGLFQQYGEKYDG
jgi:hypothetical protein